jgi:hypothetical protein
MNSEQPRTISLSDLAQMTLRGNVAFAVRCAERLRPCFELPADAPRRREQIAAVDAAIRVAAAFCRGLPVEAGRAAAAAKLAGVVAEETCESTRFAGYAAVRAAAAAAHAEEYVHGKSDSSISEVVAAAFGAGRVLAGNSDLFTQDLILAALFADMENLVSLAKGASQDLGPPIDPSESGPLGSLWPAGTPAWFGGNAPEVPGAAE